MGELCEPKLMFMDVSKIKIVPDNENNIYLLYDENDNIINIPESIAIILDGNGRYAKKKNMPRELGHKAGCEALEVILEEAVRIGVKFLTVYAFSTENWKRSESEINALFNLFFLYLGKIEEKATKNNVKVSFIGDIYKFPKKLYDECERLMSITKDNSRCVFSIAFNYGSRDEIVRTIKKLDSEHFDFSKITEKDISDNLDTRNIKDPDLLIRTSGEFRLSNFLLWQIAYSEIYISDVLWPEFTKEEFYKAIISYNSRDRRFGGRKEK